MVLIHFTDRCASRKSLYRSASTYGSLPLAICDTTPPARLQLPGQPINNTEETVVGFETRIAVSTTGIGPFGTAYKSCRSNSVIKATGYELEDVNSILARGRNICIRPIPGSVQSPSACVKRPERKSELAIPSRAEVNNDRNLTSILCMLP
jgi:hypothetical protein